ncbi:MAG: hypothetical protein M0T82_15900 [Desulfobacteraceae bacterium]|nr:hypothetical protein [Desulfobacteraceae bacterium]
MTMRKKFLLVLTLFCTGLLLTLAPMSGAAINTGAPSYDSMMQAELDKLLDQISGRFEATGNYLERSDFYTALTKGLAEQGAIKQYYDLALAAQQLADQNKDNPELQEKARIAMDDLFLAVLNQIMLNKGLAATDQEITQALIDILEGRGEGFTEEGTPFVLDPIGSREGAPVIPPDPDVDPEDDQAFNFLFYGKAYDLEKDIDPSKSTNGILYFSNDPFKVTITLPPEIFEDNEDTEEEPEAFVSENGGSPLDSLIGDYDGPLPSVTTNYPAAVIPFLFHALPDVNDYMGDGFDLKGYLEALAGEDFILTFVRDGQVFSSTDYENLEAFVEDLSDGRPFESVAIEYIPQKIFESPDKTVNGIVKNKDFYRYTWNTLHENVMEDGESRDFPPYSATLYKNNWISYSYSDSGQSHVEII